MGPTDSGKLRVTLDDLGLVEEGDEGLVGSLDEHKLERVAVECDALESTDHGAESGTAGDYDSAVSKRMYVKQVETYYCQCHWRSRRRR